MRINSKREYWILASLSVFMLFLVPLNGFFRFIIGFPYILFVPGYLLTTVLFPKADDLGHLTRVSLSVGLSIIIVPLIGLLHNYLPWGITLLPMLLSLTIFNAVLMVLGWFRRNNLSEEQRFTVTLNIDIEKIKEKFKKNKSINFVLLAVSLIIITTLLIFVFFPRTSEHFTEFYITGQNGTTAGYPEQLEVGVEETVNAIIINNENLKTVYRIEIKVDGVLIQSINNISLRHNEKWEKMISFQAEKPNNQTKVEFLLFRDGQDNTPYRQLNLWVQVTSFLPI